MERTWSSGTEDESASAPESARTYIARTSKELAHQAMVNSTASCDDWETFSKACYHLGNRHVKIQVGERWLRMKPDYVLEDMLKLHGLTVTAENAIFAPEEGAYKGGHNHHHHGENEHHHDHG